VAPRKERIEPLADATYRKSMWCLFRANVSKPRAVGRREAGTAGCAVCWQSRIGGLTKIDTDRTFVNLISHIGYGQGESWN
jgi:hypothetical protein